MTPRTDSAVEMDHAAERLASGTAGFGTALRVQLILLHRIGRTRMLMGATALAIASTMAAEWLFSRVGSLGVGTLEHDGFTLLSLHGWIVLVAAAWGIAVWWQESPARREHVLAAPADITLQELARIVAGALWLLAMLAVATAAALLVHVAGGRNASLSSVAPAAWLALFSGPLLAYTLTATVATATRRSIAWVVVGILSMAALFALSFRSALRDAMTVGDPADVFGALRYSLFNAVGGLATTTRSQVTQISDNQTTTVSSVVHGAEMMPYWLEASLVWWTIAVLALAFVLWRRRSA